MADPRPLRARRTRRRAAALAASACAGLVLFAGPGAAGVRHGDAVPGIIRASDLERIKRALNLDRFSVIAAVRLGAVDGTEAVIAEPLPDDALARVRDGCEAEGFCPDPVGFVASRVRIVVLQGRDVTTVLTVDRSGRDRARELFNLDELGMGESFLGWQGLADGFDDHVALALTPIVAASDGRTAAGVDPPIDLRWNAADGRFDLYLCVVDDGAREPRCWFFEREK